MVDIYIGAGRYSVWLIFYMKEIRIVHQFLNDM